jgi:hypothetical protein
MKAIRFSHDYYKLAENWQGNEAILIGVSHCKDIQKLKRDHPNFIKYDATIRDKDDPWKQEQYPLEFNEGIVLIFSHEGTGMPFTTIRRFTPEKFEYYEGSLWETFQMELQKK